MLNSDAYLKLGKFTFHGFYAEFVAALILLNFMGFGIVIGYLIWGAK